MASRSVFAGFEARHIPHIPHAQKGRLAVALVALKRSGVPLTRDVVFIANADEEPAKPHGSSHGVASEVAALLARPEPS